MGWEVMPEDIKQTGEACEICGKPVKAGQKFYFGNLAGVAHAYCVWGKEEKRRGGKGFAFQQQKRTNLQNSSWDPHK